MKQALARALALLGSLAVATHFVLTAIYINPISVIGLAWRAPITAYFEPLFRQRWSLFAPDPPQLDRHLDYQCEIDGQPRAWTSRSEALLEAHARRRFGPAARLRRLETAAIAATLGVRDPILDALLSASNHADDQQREQLEDLLAERAAAAIRASETGYRLVLAYCREDLGREPQRLRYRIVTAEITRYSRRDDRSAAPELRATTLPWLAPDQFDELEARARESLQDYQRGKLVPRRSDFDGLRRRASRPWREARREFGGPK